MTRRPTPLPVAGLTDLDELLARRGWIAGELMRLRAAIGTAPDPHLLRARVAALEAETLAIDEAVRAARAGRDGRVGLGTELGLGPRRGPRRGTVGD